MRAVFRNRWFWRVVGALLAGIVLFFVGPLVAIAGWRPLGWWPVAVFFALLPIIAVGVFWWWSRRRETRANAAMLDALKPDAAAAERDEVAGKLTEALAMLRTAKLGKRGAYAYQLPWYAIIGPSGAGKTTALLNSGLNFPTAKAGEYRALRGQPITPNCDWWFTDEAVLIDTAGRYVTQDVSPADAAGWKAFLQLLRTHRPLQPLNGVIVAVPAPDFADAAKMASHAENIRGRLAEIAGTLGQDVPVYLLVTKADLLAGFREYFARATDTESDQVFGSTAPGTGSDAEAVLKGFDDLVTSISSRVVDRMQSEPQLPRRAQIAGFPAQLASLRGPISTLLASLGQKSRFDQPARVRGVYLASGAQTGNPVDRILMGVGREAIASAHAVGQGRSYFLRRFFSDLVVPEQGMAGRNPLGEKRARQRYVVAVAASAAALVVAVGVWTWGYFRNSALIDSVYATTSAYAEAAGESRGGSASVDQDLAALGVLRDSVDRMDKASDFGLGLGQGGRLGGELHGIYGRDLQRRLMPVLTGLAEERMAADAAAPVALYDDLKSYLILGGRGPSMGAQLLSWVQPAWTARGGANAESEAGDLARHTAALFEDAFKPVGIDDARVEAAQMLLRSQPAAVRVYGRLKGEALKSDQPMWSARDVTGVRPELFFDGGGAFAPGAGVPALFTRNGYDRLFLPILARGPQLLAEENWVVNDGGGAKLSPAEFGALRQSLDQLYFGEMVDSWQKYLAAIQPRKVSSLADNIQRLRDGGGAASPIAPLLRAIAKATDFTPGKPLPKPQGGLAGRALGAMGMDAGGDVPSGPRATAAAAFLPLRSFVGTGQGPGPVDQMLQAMTALADKLTTIAVLPGGGGEMGSMQSVEAKALIGQLVQNANSMPAPAGDWTRGVASDASVALGGARLAQMQGAMNASFGDQCQQSLARAFPTQPAGAADLPIETFTRFFSPGGLFAGFVSKELAGYVDTAGPQWTAKGNAGEIGLTEASVRALQAANVVTRTFFAGDPNAPRLSYQIEPVALSGATSVTLQIDGQKLTFDGKSAGPATFEWPGSGGASVAFAAPGSTVPITRAWNGPWAAFRMMKVAAIKSGAAPAIGEGSLTKDAARFDFRVRTFTGGNPFVLDPFVKVACPAPQTGRAAQGPGVV